LDSTGDITMAVKSWQLGYDATTGNFVELDDIAAADPNDPRVVAFENQVTAIMEQKGLLASQAQQYVANAYAQGTTLDALKHTSQQTGTAEERGDVWGASGADKGKSYLTTQASSVQGNTGDWKINAGLIEKLYTEGFGREADTDGLAYWTKQMTDGTMSYADIAKSFGVSEEAKVRDVYHQNYGRDADDAGLQYWLKEGSGGSASADAVMKDAGTLETQLREAYGTHLGQFSNEADRQANIAAGGIWTDVQEGGYKNLDWRDYDGTKTTGVQTDFGDLRYDFGTDKTSPFGTGDDLKFAATGTASKGDQKTGLAKFQAAILGEQGYTSVNDPYRSTDGSQVNIRGGADGLEDVRNILAQRERVMHIGATYDKDDAEGGSGIGRMFTLAEMEPYMSHAEDLNDLATKLGAEKWDLLTKELTKTIDGDWKKPIIGDPIYDPGTNPDVRDTNTNTLSNNYQVPVPPDYSSNPTANVTRKEIDYMPPFDGTVPNRPLKQLDSSVTTAPQQAVRKQGAFVAGTSAQGVRRKQSSAARSGRSAMGTKQLARNNMQIKSLNI
jgi:hypothetical protein